jgi:hypothetical protein
VLFLLSITDLPKFIESKVIPILFADDTSILITSPNSTKLQNDTNIVFKQITQRLDLLIESFFQAKRDCKEDISTYVVALQKLSVDLND